MEKVKSMYNQAELDDFLQPIDYNKPPTQAKGQNSNMGGYEQPTKNNTQQTTSQNNNANPQHNSTDQNGYANANTYQGNSQTNGADNQAKNAGQDSNWNGYTNVNWDSFGDIMNSLGDTIDGFFNSNSSKKSKTNNEHNNSNKNNLNFNHPQKKNNEKNKYYSNTNTNYGYGGQTPYYAAAGTGYAAGYAVQNKSKYSWLATLILCAFLGTFGIHRFYVGKTATGLLYLFTGGLFGIGYVIDIIMICCQAFTDRNGYRLKC